MYIFFGGGREFRCPIFPLARLLGPGIKYNIPLQMIQNHFLPNTHIENRDLRFHCSKKTVGSEILVIPGNRATDLVAAVQPL